MNNLHLLKIWVNAITNTSNDLKQWEDLDKDLQLALEPLRDIYLKNSNKVDFLTETINSLPNPTFVKTSDLKFCIINKSYENYFKVHRTKLLDKNVLEVEHLSEEDKTHYHNQDLEMLNNLATIHYETTFNLGDEDTHQALYWSKSFSVESTKENGIVGEIVDISMQKELESKLSENIEELKIAYTTDFTTGLFNRYGLHEKTPELLENSKLSNHPMSILVADLDNFKNVNDTYGHSVGDEVIFTFANTLKSICRNSDICARYGGEEFLVLLSDTNLQDAISIGKEICKTFENTKILKDGKKVTVSIGATEYTKNEQLEDLFLRGDKALYIRKNSGKNGVSYI